MAPFMRMSISVPPKSAILTGTSSKSLGMRKEYCEEAKR